MGLGAMVDEKLGKLPEDGDGTGEGEDEGGVSDEMKRAEDAVL